MSITAQIAKHLREVFFGGNWTDSSLKTHLKGITWEQATTKTAASENTIASLVFHINYYVGAAMMVLEGRRLDAHDKYSFDHPPVHSEEDWNKLVDDLWRDAEKLATLIGQLPDNKLEGTFFDEKYGNYYRNLHGVIEHTHYHLGQIVLIKKMVRTLL